MSEVAEYHIHSRVRHLSASEYHKLWGAVADRLWLALTYMTSWPLWDDGGRSIWHGYSDGQGVAVMALHIGYALRKECPT